MKIVLKIAEPTLSCEERWKRNNEIKKNTNNNSLREKVEFNQLYIRL